jgi:transcriptional regulator with PAS, ATPase and Fis domain
VDARMGHIESAEGGTLFLNEISDLPLPLQTQLLHFLDTRRYRRVGGTEWRTFDGLIITATNADLAQRVAEGTFRKDLLYRLSGCVLELPPLRERPEDIEDLAAFFLDEFAQAGRPRCVLQKLAVQRLIDCRWDGNIRELKACLQRAVDNSSTGMIYPHDLDSPSLPPLSGHRVTSKAHTLREKLIAHEIRLIIEALQLSGGNVWRAAKYLGLSDAGVHRRVRKYGLERYTRAGMRKPTGHNNSVRHPNGSDSSEGSDQ